MKTYTVAYWGPCDDAEAVLETISLEASSKEDAAAKTVAIAGVDIEEVYWVRESA